MKEDLEYFDIESTLDPWPRVEYTEEEKAAYAELSDRLKEMTKDKKIVVLGAGGWPIGGYREGELSRVCNTITDMEIRFADVCTSTLNQGIHEWEIKKARKGPGHNKFKKRKK